MIRKAFAVAAGLFVLAATATACTSAHGRSASSGTSTSHIAAASASTTSPQAAATTIKPLAVSAIDGVAVTGAFDSEPTIKVDPQRQPPTTTETSIVIKGPGIPLHKGDLAVVDDVGRTWRSSDTFEDSFIMGHAPDTLPVGTSPLTLPGLVQALVGIPVGSRVVVVVPPQQGFGATKNGVSGVLPTDTAVIVFDVVGSYAADAAAHGKPVSAGGGGLPTVSEPANSEPVISIPKTPPPAKLSVTTLIQGDGPAVTQGQLVIVQYVGEIWASGKVFDSSWQRHLPAPVPIGDGALIPAWDTGLVGVKLGSRVLIVAPPADGYGSSGAPQAGITPNDTLVFVVDVLGAYNM